MSFRAEIEAVLLTPDELEQPAALIARAQALLRRVAVDVALDREQDVDAFDSLDGDRRLVARSKNLRRRAPSTRRAQLPVRMAAKRR